MAASEQQKRAFDPMVFLSEYYDEIEPIYSYNAKTPDEHAEWATQFRAKLIELLGGFPVEKAPLDPVVEEVVEFDDYTRERVVFNTRKNMSLPAYLLLPKNTSGKIPGIVCLPGHGPGKDTIVGYNDDGTPREEIGGYQNDFAIQAARRGYAALAIEQAAFGEREGVDERQKGCQVPSLDALMVGLTMIGIRVWDARRALDYLLTREEVDDDRIGVMGISGGGTTTVFSAAVEPRFKVAFPSGYLCTFRDSIMDMHHCVDNFVPGIIRWGEMYDVASLIAPRPLFAESGTLDTIFPVDATRKSVALARRAWDVLGVPEKIGHEVFEGEHQFHGVGGFEFLDKYLKNG
jgi:hypothetical protein